MRGASGGADLYGLFPDHRRDWRLVPDDPGRTQNDYGRVTGARADAAKATRRAKRSGTRGGITPGSFARETRAKQITLTRAELVLNHWANFAEVHLPRIAPL